MVNTHSAQPITTADRVIELVRPQTALRLPFTDDDATSRLFAFSQLLGRGTGERNSAFSSRLDDDRGSGAFTVGDRRSRVCTAVMTALSARNRGSARGNGDQPDGSVEMLGGRDVRFLVSR